MSRSYRFDTVAIHAGQPSDPLTGAVCTPVYQTTTYAQDELGGKPEYCYSRTGNPTRAALEESLAAVEGGRFGFAFASGLAAANAVLQGLLSAGDHVVASQDLYGGCYRLFTKIFQRFGVQFSLIDSTDPAQVASAVRPSTRLLWLETPSNPLLRVTDIRAAIAASRSRRIGVPAPVVLVDNTFATPVHQRPLELGADLVLHSTTKYIGGHCDVIGGAVVTRDEDLAARLKFVQNATGAVPGPQDCFLLLRGLKTLSLRVERHAAIALELARRLENHPEVGRVYYPGLPGHPHHEIARRQQSAFGAIIGVELRGGVQRVRALVPHLQLWPLAESLGGVKSLLCHPATMTHAAVEPEERRRIGIGDGLIRLSVGLEDVEDLYEDLDLALAATAASVAVPASREAVPA
ncbi:MAG: PLP-dependent transferase [Phycisphaerales bacterium]|nr:PLP-dependent transferase [Phycisphaerales bacterium]